jgi:PAS domain S-box-containing protein
MEVTQNRQLDSLLAYCHRLEEMVSKRSSEFAVLNSMLTRESRRHRITEDGLLLRASILDNTGDAVFLINVRGGLIYVNNTATVLYGYNRDEFLNMRLSQLLEPVPDAADLESKRINTVLEKGQYKTHTTHQRKDGSLMPVHIHYKLIKTTHGAGIVVVIRDITNEMKLRMLRDRLPCIVWTTDADLVVTSISEIGRELIGFEECPNAGMGLAELLEKVGAGKETLDKFVKDISQFTGRCCKMQFNKAGRDFMAWIAPFFNRDGQLLGTTSFLIDANMRD